MEKPYKIWIQAISSLSNIPDSISWIVDDENKIIARAETVEIGELIVKALNDYKGE